MSTTPAHESTLPAVLTAEHMSQLLGMSVRTLSKARKRKDWKYPELDRLDRKPRWSREVVLSIINGAPALRPRRIA